MKQILVSVRGIYGKGGHGAKREEDGMNVWKKGESGRLGPGVPAQRGARLCMTTKSILVTAFLAPTNRTPDHA